MFSYLCVCIHQVYGRIYRVVEPKRARLHGAMTQLAEKQASLAEAQGKLREVSVCVSLSCTIFVHACGRDFMLILFELYSAKNMFVYVCL